MKILYIITKSNWGGAQRNCYDLATAMKGRGHSVSVALGGDGELRKRLEDAGIKTYRIAELGRDVSVGKDAGSMRAIYSVMRRERPDVVHLHSPKAAGLGAVAARLLRVKKIVYTVHGWAFNEDRPFLQKLAIAFFSWLTLILVHRAVILSEREYGQALYFPLTKKRLSLIPLGLEQPVFMSIDGARQTLGKLAGMEIAEFNKKLVIGTIAELVANKGLSYLVNAMAQVAEQHDNAVLIVIGDGELGARLRELIALRKLGDKIKLVGYIANASHYLKAFNIFVLPSLKEGLPYALLEAGYASLPVVATTVGGIPEIIEDMKTGVLVQPKNERELSHAISFMIEHQAMRRQYGNALRSSVIDKFSMAKMLDATEALYKSAR